MLSDVVSTMGKYMCYVGRSAKVKGPEAQSRGFLY